MKKLQRLLFILLFTPLVSEAAWREINLISAGADPNGRSNVSDILTNLITLATNEPIRIPFGRYLVTKTITLPSGTKLYGDAPELLYKGAGLRGPVFFATNNITIFRTTPTTNTMLSGEWTASIVLRNISTEGPWLQGTAPSDGSSWGFDFQGVNNFRLSGLKAEGFSGGIRIRNNAEISMRDCMWQNNYYGRWEQRDPNTLDGKYYDSLITTFDEWNENNVVPITLYNPRFSTTIGGVIINNLSNDVPKVFVTNVRDDSQISLQSLEAAENQSIYSLVKIDGYGAGSIEIVNCNLGVDQNAPVIESSGYVDSLTIRGGQLQRRITNDHSPIIWLKTPTIQTNNAYLRQNSIVLDVLHPSWYNVFVRNDQPGRRPENDYTPPGYIQINPFPNTGQAGNDGVIAIAGNYSYTTNSITDIAKVYWQSTNLDEHVYTFNVNSNYARGIDQFYATALVYDNGGTNVPLVIPQGWGDQGVGWERISQSKIGTFTNANTGVVFSKWAWLVTLKDQSYAAAGLNSVQLFYIYGTSDAGTKANYGLERFCVYVPQQKNPYVPRMLTHSSKPVTGLEGFHTPNNSQGFYWNDFSSTRYPLGWKNVAYGQPGTWVSVGDVYGNTNRNQYSIPTLQNTDDNGLQTTNSVYVSSDGKRVSIGTSDTATYPLFLFGPSDYSLATLRLQQPINPAIQLSDGIDYASSVALDSTNNFMWLGESSSHLKLQSGNVYMGGSLSVSGTLLAASISTPLFEATDLNTSTLTTTNGLKFISTATGPTAASIGAGNGQLWLSNSSPPTLYFRYTTDGVAATDKLLSP